MRTDAATLGGITHHQVVEPGVRHEIEVSQQLCGCRQIVVHSLYQHGPFQFFHAGQIFCRERGVVEFPLAAPVHHRTRLHVGVAGQFEQLLRGQQAVEMRQCLAYQQRFLLPVIAQETVDSESAEQ